MRRILASAAILTLLLTLAPSAAIAPPAEAATPGPLIGFVTDGPTLYDRGYNQAGWIGVKAGATAVKGRASVVLSQKPSLLLVDEVMHMLDPYIRDLFIGALIEHMASSQATVLTVNHTFSEIERLPERVLVMDGGRFVVDETAEALPGQMKKVVGRDPLPEGLPCFFSKVDGMYKEYYIYPFREELRAGQAIVFQDIALPEIIKAFIGGGYEQKRMA